jgi:hypothetical protein
MSGTVDTSDDGVERAIRAEWQPIETAPHTLGPHLLWGRGWDRPDLCVQLTRGRWHHVTGQAVVLPPTHWMPLPAPPQEAARDGGS